MLQLSVSLTSVPAVFYTDEAIREKTIAQFGLQCLTSLQPVIELVSPNTNCAAIEYLKEEIRKSQ